MRRAAAADPTLRRFLTDGDAQAKVIGLKPNWIARVIEAGGNSGEIYERHLGAASALPESAVGFAVMDRRVHFRVRDALRRGGDEKNNASDVCDAAAF
jgi:hypothetical protein